MNLAMNLFRTKKRKFDDHVHLMWIKYFEDSGKSIDIGPSFGEPIRQIVLELPTKTITKQMIYTETETESNRDHLVQLFELGEPISEKEYSLIEYLSNHIEVLTKRTKLWNLVSKPVMRILIRFFYIFAENGGTTSPARDVNFVSVAIALQKVFEEDIIHHLGPFLMQLVGNHTYSELTSDSREFVTQSMIRCQSIFDIQGTWGLVKTHVLGALVRYFLAVTAELTRGSVTRTEIQCTITLMNVFSKLAPDLGKLQRCQILDTLFDTIMEMYGVYLRGVAMGYDIDDLYNLGMTGFDALVVLRRYQVNLKDRVSNIQFLMLFVVWCIDYFGFHQVPLPVIEFDVQVPEEIVHTGFNFVKKSNRYDPRSDKWKFRALDLKILSDKALHAMNRCIGVLQAITKCEKCVDIYKHYFGNRNIRTLSCFKNPNMAEYYIVFMMCYLCMKSKNLSQKFCEMLFSEWLWDYESDGTDYDKRCMVRNFVYQVMIELFQCNKDEIASNLLEKLNWRLYISVEIISVFGELLRVYRDEFISTLSLDNIFKVDRTLEKYDRPYREAVVVFLNQLVEYDAGKKLLLSDKAYITRILEWSFDSRLIVNSFTILQESIHIVSEIEYFENFFECVSEVLMISDDFCSDDWRNYLSSLLTVLGNTMSCFRLFYGSSKMGLGKMINLLVEFAKKMVPNRGDIICMTLEVFRLLIAGDTEYRRLCEPLYNVSIMEQQLEHRISNQIMSIVYEEFVDYLPHLHFIKNPDALWFLHTALLEYPDEHTEMFTRVVADMKSYPENQIVVARSQFIINLMQFLNEKPDHFSYHVFAELIALVFANFFEVRFFQVMVQNGISKSWERILRMASEREVTPQFQKSFIYLSGGDNNVKLKYQRGHIQNIDFSFSVPHLPHRSRGHLLDIVDGSDCIVTLLLGKTGQISIIDSKSDLKKETPTWAEVRPGVIYKCSVVVQPQSLMLNISNLLRYELKLLHTDSFNAIGVCFGRSVGEYNRSIPMTIYEIQIRAMKIEQRYQITEEIFATDCSCVDDTQLVNMCQTMETLSTEIKGYVYQRRVTMTDTLLGRGGILDIVNSIRDSTGLGVFLRLLKNYIEYEPSFEDTCFEVARQTGLWRFMETLDQSIITEECVHDLYELTKAVDLNKNGMLILHCCWFAFDFWATTSVYDTVFKTIIPEFMTLFPSAFTQSQVTINTFLCSGNDSSSFWFTVCQYLLLSEKENDQRALMLFVLDKKPIYFFLNFFGVMNLCEDTDSVIQKFSEDDVNIYFDMFMSLMLECDTSMITQEVCLNLVERAMRDESSNVFFDVAMLVCQYISSAELFEVIKNICVGNDALKKKLRESRFRDLWLLSVVVRSQNDIVDLEACRPEVIEFLVFALENDVERWQELIHIFFIFAVNGKFDVHGLLQRVCIVLLDKMNKRKSNVRIEWITFIVTYLFAIPDTDKYSHCTALSRAMEVGYGDYSASFKQMTFPGLIALLRKNSPACEEYNVVSRMRISESGEWIDANVAVEFLKLLADPDVQNMSIDFSAHQQLKMHHVRAHLICLLMAANHISLKDVDVDSENIDSIAMQMITYEAFKQHLKYRVSEEDINTFISVFWDEINTEIQEIGEIRGNVYTAYELIGSGFCETSLMWQKLLSNFVVVIDYRHKNYAWTVFGSAPFRPTPETLPYVFDDTRSKLQKWKGMYTIRNALADRFISSNTPDIPITSRSYLPVSMGRHSIRFVEVEDVKPLITDESMLVGVTLKWFNQTVKTFLYCNEKSLTIAGLEVLTINIRCTVRHSPTELEFFLLDGTMLYVVFSDEETSEHIFYFIKESSKWIRDGMNNTDLIPRANFIFRHSYNHTPPTMLWPVGSETTSELAVACTAMRENINALDMTDWIRSNFKGANGITSNPVLTTRIDTNIVCQTGDIYFVAIESQYVIMMLSKSPTDACCKMINILDCSTTSFTIRFPISSNMRFCFFNDSVFLVYSPITSKIYVYDRFAEDSTPIGSFAIKSYLKTIRKVDHSRLLLILGDNTLMMVYLVDGKSIEYRRIYWPGHGRIVTSSVNHTLNMFGVADESGNVTLISLSTHNVLTTVNLPITRIRTMKLLNCGVIVFDLSNTIQAFAIDGTLLSTLENPERMYRLAGVVNRRRELVAVVKGDDELLLLDPLTLAQKSKLQAEMPIKRYGFDEVSGSCFIYDGHKLDILRFT